MIGNRGARVGDTSAFFALLAFLCFAAPAAAQEDQGIIDEFAAALAESLAPRWVGPRVPWPEPVPRPRTDGTMRSRFYPVNVHAASTGVDPELAADTLIALERAHAWLEEHDWPLPPPDGGRGGTVDFDLYLVDEVPQGFVQEGYDTPLGWGGLDAAITYSSMDIDVDPSRLQACVASAYVRAALFALDPAEAPQWRMASGDYLAWLMTGQWGCSDEGIIAQQRESFRTWVGHEPESGPGGALFLAMLSARTDSLSGDFIRDLWTGAPQLTWEGEGLRAAPDMWQVIHHVMEIGRDPLERLIEEMAVARYFIGPAERESGAPMNFLRELPEEAAVEVSGRTRWALLPRRFEPHGLELEPYGSAYIVVDTRWTRAGHVLRIWLRGEYGVGWSLLAVRIGRDGRERGRVRAPVRPTNSRSYIPLELTDNRTTKVLIVVTNMGSRLLDADAPDDQVRSFSLILDKVEPTR